MAALKYKEEHNKVGYLLKPTESDDYHQIIDFLSGSHIRSRLQLADDGGVIDLPILEVYSGMDNLGIETRVIRQYKLLVFSSKLFANMRLIFAGNPMPLLPAMLLQAQAGEGAEVAAQDILHPMPAPDQSPPHLTTPSRLQSPDPVAPVLEHDHSSTQPETADGSFPSTKDAHLGGDFHTSPLRSSHTPPTGQPLGGEEDPITLTALSSIVSTLVQKVHSLEAELHDHRKLFKDVVGKLVKKVKSLEVKLKTKKRKLVVSDSDEKDDAPTDVPAATSTTPADAFDIAPGASSVAPGASSVAPGASGVAPGDFVTPTTVSAVFADSPNVPAGPSNKGKSPMVEEDIPIPARTFRQREEDRLGEEAARRLHEEEMAEIERERAEAHRKRQQEVLESAKFYNEDDWLNIRAQVAANASLSKNLLGDDVSEDNFPARMAALIKKKRQALAEQLFKERLNRPLTLTQQKAYMRQYVKNKSSVIYNTGWFMAYVKSFSDEQLLQEFEKIRKVQSQSQLQAFSRTLKRPGSVLEEPPTKKPKSPEAPTPSMPEIPISPAVTSPPSSRTRRKSLVIIDEDSDDEDSVDEVWSAVVGWEILSTPLGDINALYRTDVIQYYEHHTATGAGLLFWGDLEVLFDSYAGGMGSSVWQNQHLWEIRNVSYPLSLELMKKILLHKLEIDSDFMGNNLTTAEQLIQFIKDQIVAAHASSV
nr:JmjC domain-containing protein [Tanacetum cinerariifolium]